MKNNSKNKKIT